MSGRTLGIRLALLIGLTAACAPDGAEWTAGTLQLTVDGTGHVVRLVDETTGADHAANCVGSPLLSVQTAGVLHPPHALSWDAAAGIATLEYPDGLTARIAVAEKETHLVLELLEVSAPVELVVWGPYATSISETIGETVGVVRDSGFAIGIQALNPKTLGGLPWRDNDFPPQVDLFESGDFSDLDGRRALRPVPGRGRQARGLREHAAGVHARSLGGPRHRELGQADATWPRRSTTGASSVRRSPCSVRPRIARSRRSGRSKSPRGFRTR